MPEQNTGQPAETTDNVSTPTSADTQSTLAAAQTGQQATPENNVSGKETTTQTGPSEEAQKYLSSQNIDLSKLDIDSNDQSAVNAFIAGHKLMRKSNNSSSKTETKPQAGQPTQAQEPTTSESPKLAVSKLGIMSVKASLEKIYPDTDPSKLGTDEFYRQMNAAGVSPVRADGALDEDAILSFAATVAKDDKIERLEAELAKRPTSDVPDVDNSIQYAEVELVKEMTPNAAAAIIMASNKARSEGRPIHPQTAEAELFLKNSTK